MKYTGYYVFQFQDGTWRISPMTNRRGERLPYAVLDGVYPTRAAAETALRDAA